MQTAKVYIWKDKEEEPVFSWKIGSLKTDEMVIIHKEFATYAEAWEWLYANYVRETP